MSWLAFTLKKSSLITSSNCAAQISADLNQGQHVQSAYSVLYLTIHHSELQAASKGCIWRFNTWETYPLDLFPCTAVYNPPAACQISMCFSSKAMACSGHIHQIQLFCQMHVWQPSIPSFYALAGLHSELSHA